MQGTDRHQAMIVRLQPGRKSILPLLLGLAVFLLSCVPSSALDPRKAITQYMQTVWGTEAGLPQTSVFSITQTRDGYLWMGTQQGLARFDGVRFAIFDQHKNKGLASNYVQTLLAGRDGSLWAGTDSGLSHFKDGVFDSFTTANGLSNDNVTALLETEEGSLWIGTDSGLNRLQGGKIRRYTNADGLPGDRIRAIAEDRNGSLWIGTNHGLAQFRQGSFRTVPLPLGHFSEAVTALAAAPDGTLWAATSLGRLAHITREKISFTSGLPVDQIESLLIDRDANLWIAFDRRGMARLHDAQLSFYSAADGLPGYSTTNSLFEDREGNVWLGLFDAGAVQWRDGKFANIGKAEGLTSRIVWNVMETRDGRIWAGTDNDGINRLKVDGETVQVEWHGIPKESVHALAELKDGSVVAGLPSGRLLWFNHDRVTRYQDQSSLNGAINALFEDKAGTLWFGTSGDGFGRFQNGRFEHITTSSFVRAIAEAPDGALWLAFDGEGIGRYQNGVLKTYTVKDGILADHVMCLYVDGQGVVWAGTAYGGLNRIKDGHITSYSTEQGLFDSTVGTIAEDNLGNLWMGSDNGIFHVSKQELNDYAEGRVHAIHSVAYGTADGLRARETTYGDTSSVWKSRDGRLWFTTMEGLAVIDPANMPRNQLAPPVWVESASIDHKSIPLENGIRLAPGEGNVQIEFSAPSFVAATQVRFRYRLSGFDREWIEAGDRRTAFYTNLPARDYTFEVQAANSDGVWNTQGASFTFTLRPPRFRSPLAYTGYVLAALLITWGVVVLRTRSLVRRRNELERIVAERTWQLETEKQALLEVRQALQTQATRDSLTMLWNRGAILEHLEHEMERAVREHTTLGVVLADLDHFKSINDNYGHLCGDEVLREAAQRLLAAMRGYDMVGRYGGEEFLILLPGYDPRKTPERIDELVAAIGDMPVEACNVELNLTCSFGVATFHPDIDTASIEAVLSRADAALYVAKNAGRNCAGFDVRLV